MQDNTEKQSDSLNQNTNSSLSEEEELLVLFMARTLADFDGIDEVPDDRWTDYILKAKSIILSKVQQHYDSKIEQALL